MNKKIKDLRVDSDLKQKEVSYMLDETRSNYANMESHLYFKYACDTMFKLSLIYEVSPLYLYGISNDDLHNLKKYYSTTVKRKEKVFNSKNRV